MKIKIFLSAILSFSFCLLSSQVPQGFNYMAIARNSSGVLANQDLTVKIAILTGMPGEYTVLWEERHAVNTNNEGLFRLVVGDPNAERLETSTVTYFSDIDWHIQPMYVRTMINEFEMGISPLFSVPYALLAKDIEGPVNKLGVEGTTDLMDEALFEVKNKDGQIIFAVYNEGVRIYVDDAGTKAAKGGFAIGSFGSTSKDGTPYQDYFKVNPGIINAYIDDTPGKAAKGGFAIGGFGSKTDPSNYLQVDIDKIKAGKVDYLNITAINTFIGTQAGKAISAGQYNAFMGYNAGLANTGGSSNVFIGNESGKANISGSSNVFIGFDAGLSNIASYNSFIGYQAGKANKEGQYNSFMGYNAGMSNTTGESNVFLGYESGKLNVGGTNNIYIGTNAGLNSNGNNNISIGNEAGKVATGDNNIFIGLRAGLAMTSGDYNLLIGTDAGAKHTTQRYNVMLGTGAGYSLTSGSYNSFMGINSGNKITYSASNTFLGTNAGAMLESGYGNTIVGIDAGRGGDWIPATYYGYTTNMNTMLGNGAGSNLLVGDGNVYIGYYAGSGEVGSIANPSNNKLYIANGLRTIIYGDFSSGRIGLGTTAPGYKLDVVGDINITGDFRVNGSPISTATLTTGNLTATGPISLSATQKVIGGPAAISIASASTTAIGAVQLSNSYSGSSQILATTEKALKDGLATKPSVTDLTNGLATKVSGSGITMGKVFLPAGGNIAEIAGGNLVLIYDAGNDEIQINNKNKDNDCFYWYRSQKLSITSSNTGIAGKDGSTIVIPNPVLAEIDGLEVHFGIIIDGTASWCSVWLQNYKGTLVGQYTMY